MGAGPAGLACAAGLHRSGYRYVVIEKGCIVDAIQRFPIQMVFFTTPERLEIAGYPVVCQGAKTTRTEALMYYRRVVQTLGLSVRQYERAVGFTGSDGHFEIETVRQPSGERRVTTTRKLVLALGNYDNPNLLNIPGEDLPKVSHYFTEAHLHCERDVVVIGSGNSGAEAALELYRAGARVTLVHRGAKPSRTLKYWVGPDLGNRIDRGEIPARFLTEVTEIDASSVHLRHVETGETHRLPNDYVFALTGYHADFDLMRRLGISVDERTLKPAVDPETFESNIPGLYLAGVMIAGIEANKVFIENGRFHGEKIVAALREVAPPGRETAVSQREP